MVERVMAPVRLPDEEPRHTYMDVSKKLEVSLRALIEQPFHDMVGLHERVVAVLEGGREVVAGPGHASECQGGGNGLPDMGEGLYVREE